MNTTKSQRKWRKMFKNAKIIGTGSYLPKRQISNEQIEALVYNFDVQRAGMPFTQWVEKVTGVRTSTRGRKSGYHL
jgi:3-oxoacyl-[acyl-carrier-protein] synthase III